jgi:RNA polymerase sigma-70 factor (ECF subfamily)
MAILRWYSDRTDEDVVKLCQGRDEKAFEELYERYKTPLYSFIYRAVKNRHDAEDVLQEAFVRVYQAIARYKENSFKNYVYTIAHNLCKDKMKSFWARKSRPMDRTTVLIVSEKDGAGTEQSEIASAVQSMIDELTNEQRESIIMNKYQDLSYKEIAEICNCSVEAVKQRIYRAHIILKEKLKPFIGG